MTQYSIVEHPGPNGLMAELRSPALIVEDNGDWAQLVGEVSFNGYSGAILHRHNLCPGFFDLKTGIAGGLLQKFSNYRLRLAIVGSFEELPGQSVHDFIRECNRGGQVAFVSSLDEALRWLSGR